MNPFSLRFHRTLLVVSDMDRSLSFYRDVLGLKVTRDAVRSGRSYDEITEISNVKLRVVFVEASDGGLIELVQFLESRSGRRIWKRRDAGSCRICFRVLSVDAAVDEIVARGAAKGRGPIVLEREGVKIANLFYLLDPDGVEIELIEMLAAQ